MNAKNAAITGLLADILLHCDICLAMLSVTFPVSTCLCLGEHVDFKGSAHEQPKQRDWGTTAGVM